MTEICVSSVRSLNATSNLVISTANTSGYQIDIGSGSMKFKSNSTFDVVTINATHMVMNTSSVTYSNPATFGNTVYFTSNTTFSGNNRFTSNVIFEGTVNFQSNTSFGNVFVTGSINASALYVGNSSISSNGYTRLTNGLLMQWFAASVPNTGGFYNWPTAFANLYSIQSAAVTTSNVSGQRVQAVTTVGANLSHSIAGSLTFYVLGIGI